MNNNFLDTYQLKSQNAILDGTIERIIRARRTAASGSTFRFARANEVDAGTRLRPGHARAPDSVSTTRSSTPRPGPELVIDDRFPAADLSVGVGERPRAVLRRNAHPAARLQEVHERLHPRLPLRRPRPAPDPRAPAPRHGRGRPGTLAADSRGDHRGRHRPDQPHLGAVAAVRRSSPTWSPSPADRPATTRRCRSTTCATAAWAAEHVRLRDHPGVRPRPRPGRPVRHHRVPDRPGRRRAARTTPATCTPSSGSTASGQLISTHHLAENLENHWDLPEVHVRPLQEFLGRCLFGAEG